MAAACTSGSDDPDPVAVVERFVAAWVGEPEELAAIVTGPDAERLVAAVAAFPDGDVVRSTLEGATELESDAIVDATAVLHFPDTGRLELTIRVEVADEEVVAAPAAISVALDGWERLRLDAFGDPARGRVLGRTSTVLATGPRGARTVARDALRPAVTLIDRALDVELGGRRGRRLRAGDPGRVIAESEPVDGQDVTTSIDDALQAAAEQVAGTAPGALVAVDPDTGGIRALVSNPEPRLLDRSPATSAYSPGSSFKIVTAAAALESGAFVPDDIVDCPGRITTEERQISNFEGQAYGPITFERAFAVSCNTAFAQVGMRIGTVALLGTAERLGFAVDDLDRPGTITVPRSRAELGVWSYGAAGSLASPLQMAGLAATVAREGMAVIPQWTDRGEPGERVLERSTAAALVEMMEEVVETGTGRNAAIPGITIAGKTGTGDPEFDQSERSNAWFVAIAPSRPARLAVTTLIPGGGLGGEFAASLTQKFLLATQDAWAQDTG